MTCIIRMQGLPASYILIYTDTEENAAKLQKAVLDVAKEITDVVSSFGGWKEDGPLLQQSVDFLMKVSHTMSFYIADRTFIRGISSYIECWCR